MSKQWWSGHQDYNHWLEALDSGKGPQLFDIEHFRGRPSDDNLTHGFHVIGGVLTNRKIYLLYSVEFVRLYFGHKTQDLNLVRLPRTVTY